jgi:hypothetical protein
VHLAVISLAGSSLTEDRMGAWDDAILHARMAASIAEEGDRGGC